LKAVFLALLLPVLANAAEPLTDEPITEERQEGLKILTDVQVRLGALRATLFEEQKWSEILRIPYYWQRKEAVALEEALDDPHTGPSDLQRGVQAVKYNYQLLSAIINYQGVSHPVRALKEQLDITVQDLETLVMTIPD